MPLQPDLHYDGPLTIEYIQGLQGKLKECGEEIQAYEPQLEDDLPDWEMCRLNWLESLMYANMRCSAIWQKIEAHLDTDSDDRKCIDITLCILRDYEQAKNKRFLRDN